MKLKQTLKKQMLLILFLIPMTKNLYCQEKNQLKQNFAQEFGIELNQNYNGDTVIDYLSIVIDEAEISIDKAYDEGYKQATIELLPEVEYYKKVYSEEKKLKSKNNYNLMFGGFVVGISVGVVTGIIGFYAISLSK